MKVYKSKVSKVLILLLIFQAGIPFIWDKQSSWWFWGLVFIYILCMAYMLFSIQYIVFQEQLWIKIGFVKVINIDVKTIRKIEKTNSILSSPAASFDRIEVFYNRYDSVILSPKNTKGFIANLLAINPNIELKI